MEENEGDSFRLSATFSQDRQTSPSALSQMIVIVLTMTREKFIVEQRIQNWIQAGIEVR